MGDIYGMSFRLSGVKPSVTIYWGDGKKDTAYGNEIDLRHKYPRKPSMNFIVEAEIHADEILYASPVDGDCEMILFDFSQAPSTKEIWIENFKNVILDNPNLELLTMRILLGKEYDLSKCPNLKRLSFSPGGCGHKIDLDLSNCHKLEEFSCYAYLGPDVCRITFANDAPLKEVDITGHNLHPSCLEAIYRIVEKNNGVIMGEFENDEDDEDE